MSAEEEDRSRTDNRGASGGSQAPPRSLTDVIYEAARADDARLAELAEEARAFFPEPPTVDERVRKITDHYLLELPARLQCIDSAFSHESKGDGGAGRFETQELYALRRWAESLQRAVRNIEEGS